MEVTETDLLMSDLGITVGDVIVQIGDQEATALSVDEAGVLLERAGAGEISVTWRTPDDQLETRRLQP